MVYHKGYCICSFFGGNLVTRKIKEQAVVGRSSAKVEYRAIAHTTYEIVLVCSFLEEAHSRPSSYMEIRFLTDRLSI